MTTDPFGAGGPISSVNDSLVGLKPKDNVSRIIPIKVERGAFNPQQQQYQQSQSASAESPVVINDLDELRKHQTQSKAEETIRGYSRPVSKVNYDYINYYIINIKSIAAKARFIRRF